MPQTLKSVGVGHGLDVCRVFAHLDAWRWLGGRAKTGQTGVFFVTWAVQTPKRRVDPAVLGACQRCSPLPQTYGKSAGMVWGRRDHFCYRWIWSVDSVHTTRAPAANCSALFCGKLIGARVVVRASDFEIHRCRAWSRGLQSFCAFGCMALVRRARQNGSNRGIFRDLGGTDPKTKGRSGGPGGLPKVQPAPPDVWKVSRHGLGAAGPLLLPLDLVG